MVMSAPEWERLLNRVEETLRCYPDGLKEYDLINVLEDRGLEFSTKGLHASVL